MLSYCLKCRKNTESKTLKIVWTKNGSIMLLSKYSVCNSKKSRLIKEQELIELLSSLLIKPALIKFFYWFYCFVLRVSNKLMQGIKWMKWLTSFY